MEAVEEPERQRLKTLKDTKLNVLHLFYKYPAEQNFKNDWLKMFMDLKKLQ